MSRKLLALTCVILLAVSVGLYIYVRGGTGSEKVFVVGNGEVAFRFSSVNYSLLEIVDYEKERKIEFSGAPLWKIVLLDIEKAGKGGEKLGREAFLELSSDSAFWARSRRIIAVNDEKVLQLTWEKAGYGKITVNIKLPRNSPISTWNITVENKSEKYAIWFVDFPYLRVKPLGGAKDGNLLALPVHGGALIKNPFDNIDWSVQPWEEVLTGYRQTARIDVRGSYPGNYNAQFAALYDTSGEGLYIASYDGNMYAKRFLFRGDGETLYISIRNYPEKMLTPGVSYAVPYEFKVGIFHGDWMNAADIYKEWAKKQVWCSKGPMYKWKDLSKCVYEIDLTTIVVYRVALDAPVHYSQIRDDLLAMKEFFDKYASVGNSTPKIGVHWIGWSKYLDVVNKNSGFPNYLPPQENFTRLIDELRSTGSFCNDVYLTTHGFDMNTPYQSDDKYAWKDYREYACYSPLGQPYTRFTPHTAWMNPDQREWQNVVIEVSRQTQETCHLDGEYFDWYPKFRLDFKHHEGGGNYFATGYREEVKRIRETIRRSNLDYYCYPEGKSEIEVGVFDGMLMEWFHSDDNGVVRPFANIGTPIPLISYLYHEYIAMAGGIRVKNKDFSGFGDPSSFRLVSAIIWAWGNKPQYPFVDGRLRPDSYVFIRWKEGTLDPVWMDNLVYLANLVKMYKIAKDAMFFGEMMRPPRIAGVSIARVNIGGRTMNVPSIILAAFKAPGEKAVYIPLTNWGSRDETITGIDFSRCEWANPPYCLSIVRSDSVEILGTFNKTIISTNIKVTRGEAIYIVLESEGS